MESAEALIRETLAAAGIAEVEVTTRPFDGETVYRVAVPASDTTLAKNLVQDLEERVASPGQSALIVVRPLERALDKLGSGPVRTLNDPRVSALTQLLTSRSRTSEAQPSLSYIPNDTANISLISGARNHLVFGRRGAGKTALLLEARRTVEGQGGITVWVNLQPWRKQSVERTFLGIQSAVLRALIAAGQSEGLEGRVVLDRLTSLSSEIDELQDDEHLTASRVERLQPKLQATIGQATISMSRALYIFLDDFYYFPRASQADLLDSLSSTLRDLDAWLKVASIRHLTRWFRPYPPVGLQTGQDADLVDLDLTLQDPTSAVAFLERMFLAYCNHVGISTLSAVLSREAFERLVFASGGVPRDFLNLAASATTRARSRPSARSVGVVDVNQAAGDAARSKIAELEDDLASNIGLAPQAYQALNRVRDFCIDDCSFTYFRVDFRDRDRNPDAHAILTRLLEARLVHLIDSSVSDRDKAGERSECYTLDLSQYSGSRLKQKLRVLDLHDGKLISKQTRVAGPEYVGSSARQVLQILRGAPLFPLARFKDLVTSFEPAVDDVATYMSKVSSATIEEIVLTLGRPYHEVATELSDMVEQDRLSVIEEGGLRAYKWLG